MKDSKMNLYVDYINEHVLTRIDYARLQKDYETEEKAYAKGVLNALHKGVLEIYGTETFDQNTVKEGFVLLPGVLQSREKGNLCIALLELDLLSSGEHWGTDYLIKYGCIHSEGERLPDSVQQFIQDTYGAYDYICTAVLGNDIHVQKDSLTHDMKQMLKDFKMYEFIPCNSREAPQCLSVYSADGMMER